MSFSNLYSELLFNIKYHKEDIQELLKKRPKDAYNLLNQLSEFTGSRHQVVLNLHFPNSKKIYDVESDASEYSRTVIDKIRKTFPIRREMIKQKSRVILGEVTPQDAYVYEGK